MKTGRQVSKSTFLAGFSLTHLANNPHKSIQYASTSEKQAKEFSVEKLQPFLDRSERIRAYLMNQSAGTVVDAVWKKKFSNGSSIAISYFREDGDRLRGNSADVLMLDEIQDMHASQLPVVEEVLSASLDPIRFYAGTPKTIDNHIEIKWSQSTMHEVFFRCKNCRKLNSIGYRNIGLKGPTCTHCKQYLDMSQHFTYPTYTKSDKLPIYTGIRVPQPALLLHSGIKSKWEDLLIKYESEYDEGKFKNEILGLSHSRGKRFLTKDDIIEQCTGAPTMETPSERLFRMFDMTVMGIDWSGDGVSNISKNAVVVYGRRAGDPMQKAQVIYKRIFPRQDYTVTVREMVKIANAFRVRLVGADAGEGALPNAFLSEALGANRVQPFRYGSFSIPARLSKDKRDMYLDKTQAVDDFFMNFKKGQFILPPFSTFEEESKHILSLFEVVGKSGKKIWTSSGTEPDDFTHAMIFGYNAFKMAQGSLKFY